MATFTSTLPIPKRIAVILFSNDIIDQLLNPPQLIFELYYVSQNNFAHGRGYTHPLFEVLEIRSSPFLNYYRTGNHFT